MQPPHLKMNDGHTIPGIGLGTWPLDDEQAEAVVGEAMAAGYRHVDTAVRYGNELGVGRALAASGLPREQLFVTTKLDGDYQGEDRAVDGLRRSLERLGLAQVDLLLIHWPLPQRDLYLDTWRSFERLQAEGLARSIGVSNFKPAHLRRLMAETDVVPAVNQVQLHPYVGRADHRAFHQQQGILTVAYSPLGKAGELLREPLLQEIGRRHGKTPAQVVLRWHLELGSLPIPKSADPARLRQNLDIFDFSLSADEVAGISALDRDEGVDSDLRGH